MNDKVYASTAEVMAERKGSPLSFLEVAPIEVVGGDGRRHLFHFQHRVSEKVEGLLAYELLDGEPGGYQIEVLAEPGEPRTSVVGRLLEKIRRELARTHIVEDPVVSPGFVIRDMLLRGRITYDPESEGPSAVVDGRQLDWGTFGELLLSLEGFSFRLEFFKPTDEIP